MHKTVKINSLKQKKTEKAESEQGKLELFKKVFAK